MPRPYFRTYVAAAYLIATPAVAEVPAVVTDFAPVQSLAAKVMGELGQPDTLVEQGADPHSYQLRPSQARALAGADLVIWVGPELTPWMERVLESAVNAQIIGLLADPSTMRRDYADEDAHHDEAADAEAEEGHDHHGTDPHAWLDPRNAKAWVVLIRDALVKADPQNANVYTHNADLALTDIDALEVEVAATLAPASRVPLAMGHDAYGYFADRFALTIAATVEAGDAASAGAAHLSELHAILAEKQVRCLFPEAGHDARQATVLIEGTATQLGKALDPEGQLLDRGPNLYDTLIRALAADISACVLGKS